MLCCARTLQTAHVVMYYFLITTLIIYPTAVIAAVLGIVGGSRYRHQRRTIGSFDAAQVWFLVSDEWNRVRSLIMICR